MIPFASQSQAAPLSAERDHLLALDILSINPLAVSGQPVMRSTMSQRLPTAPNLDLLKKQAKDVLRLSRHGRATWKLADAQADGRDHPIRFGDQLVLQATWTDPRTL